MASPVSTDSFLQWDPAQVSNFIASSIDKNIGPLFLNNNLDGSLLPYITTDHLRELGIEKLSVRLQVKKCIADLVYQHCQSSSSTSLVHDSSKGNSNADTGTNINGKAVEHVQPYASINNNFLHIESLSLALSLLRETFSKMSVEQQQVQQYQLQQQQLIQQQQLHQLQQIQQQQLELSNPPSPSQQQLDLKRLNENFNKLKSDLIPAIRLIKESKPLPTPTLDPGSTTLHALESPTFSISSSNVFNESNNSASNTSNNLTNSTTISNGPINNGSSNSNGGEKLSNTRRNSLTSTVVAAGSAIAAAVNFSGSLSNSNSIANINNSNSNNNSNSTNNNNNNNNSNNNNSNNGSASNGSTNNGGGGGASNSSSQHTLSNSNSNSSLNGGARISAYPPSSPTLASNRYSSGSILSMGTGKVISQSVVSSDQPTVARNSNFTLQKITNRINTNSGNNARPRLVETRSANNMLTKPSSRPHNSQSVSANALMTNSTSGNNAINGNGNTSPSNGNGASTAAASTEPLKQLRASSDDSCLKILQQAMKRHHIPRDDWSKYVLVICYGDKERILKLAEKPVIIFKELQELGKHPAIMLRQLAATKEKEEDVLYEDSRIGDDIPGGTL
ncbi:hypothetical protein CLIB1423_07S03950 [[Candida] railenensis]|uniref:Ste50p n=1 Tax=[Candida] railenensis TaxID=45579 RepID=A0A9P0VXL0_9ASCO|nr:hypothetical protein CLIB1423_07S03950 [[Candida] railenensis]